MTEEELLAGCRRADNFQHLYKQQNQAMMERRLDIKAIY